MKSYRDIPKDDIRTSVLLVGRGPSVNKLNVPLIKKKKPFDICTISDAVKLFNEATTYAFQPHWQGIFRSQSSCKMAKYVIAHNKIITDIKNKKAENTTLIKNYVLKDKNIYVYEGHHVKFDILLNGKFDITGQENITNWENSATGALVFLAGWMGYKNIFYVGFDGGRKYGDIVHSNRKTTKIEGAVKDYRRGWDALLYMVERFYSDINFKPLGDFLIK